MSLVAPSPWNLLLTWQAPDVADRDIIDYYDLTGGVIVKFISNKTYNIIPFSTGITPASEYVVNIQVVYKTGQKSGIMSVNTTTPSGRKLFVCFCLKLRDAFTTRLFFIRGIVCEAVY